LWHQIAAPGLEEVFKGQTFETRQIVLMATLEILRQSVRQPCSRLLDTVDGILERHWKGCNGREQGNRLFTLGKNSEFAGDWKILG